MRPIRWTPIVAVALLFCLAPTSASARTTEKQVRVAMQEVLASKLGPPGAIVTINRGAKTTTLAAGKKQIGTGGLPNVGDHMRLASVTKAFTGAVVLRLVDQEALALDDRVGQHLQGMPLVWQQVRIRQLLDHTSGLPDYTKSKGFFNQFQTAPKATVSPQTLLNWVRDEPMAFTPGSKYAYSNTDNIVVALIAEAASKRTYSNLLKLIILDPLKLSGTSLPTGTAMNTPFIHGYDVQREKGITTYDDVTKALSPTGAWASGGIESTPGDLGKFFRQLLAKRFFSTRVQKQQFKFVKGGESSPAGPGKNSAGLSLFRYETRCGTVYGHTGNYPGYVQFAAANRTGTRSVTTTLNIAAPTGHLLTELRELQTKAVCAMLGK